jgi:predicted dehydrogenase
VAILFPSLVISAPTIYTARAGQLKIAYDFARGVRGGLMEDKVRVGIISANWGVQAHLPAWRANSGAEVVAICTAHQDTAEAAAKSNDIPKAYWDYREMAADPDIDLIDVGTRPSLRYDMCMTALKAGKHVYNGVPFTDSMEHARDLKEAQLANRRVAAVDAYSEYLPPIAMAKELIDDGKLGQLFSLTCNLQMSLFNTATSQFPYNWFWERANGCSALRNLGTHALNILYYLFGEVAEVIGQDEQFLKEWKFLDTGEVLRPQIADTATVLLRFRNGAIGTLSTSWVAIAGSGFVLDAFGSNGRILLQGRDSFMPANDTALFYGKAGDMSVSEVDIPHRLKRKNGIGVTGEDRTPIFAMAMVFDDVLRAIRNGGDARPSFSQAYHVHCVIEAAHRSSQTRTWTDPASL